MKLRLFLFIILLAATAAAFAQSDVIMLRDGKEMNVTVVQVDDRNVMYKADGKKSSPELTVSSKDVYMIRYQKRGNVYITPEGKRITGENRKRDRNADIIYLAAGKEIQAYNLQIVEDRVLYQEPGRSKGRQKLGTVASVNAADVFMIKYKDGTRDIITAFGKTAEKTAEAAEETADEAQPEEPEELKVVFHKVKRGETLGAVASRYGVSAADVKKWNELSAKTNAGTRLTPGAQLMLYVKPVKE